MNTYGVISYLVVIYLLESVTDFLTFLSLSIFSHIPLVKAKVHYDILVADRSEAGRRPVADPLARC